MGWIQDLYTTYQKAEPLVGVIDDKGCILLPIAHSTQNAQIEIAVDLEGNFQSARKVEKAEAVTIIPVTEDSGSRSSGIAPHPLCDKLCYVAGDYTKFFNKKNGEEYYQAYVNQLEKWAEFGCHSYVNAIYTYIKKNRMVRDLSDANVIVLNKQGMGDERTKLEGIAQPEAFVRFRILDEKAPGRGEVWKQQEVYKDFINYYLSGLGKVALDYITGEYMACCEKQPSKIRNSADKTKLISANDNSGFTYRGRFISKEEALSVGFVPSQGAHNALKWLIERQAYRKFGMCIVSWNPEREQLPDWLLEDTVDLAYGNNIPEKIDFGESYAEELNKAIQGKYGVFQNPNRDIVVMELDAATPGRLAVAYYRKIRSSDFLERLIYWHSTAIWPLSFKKGKRGIPIAPEPEEIVQAAYGIERKGFLHVEDKLMKETLEYLISCILDRKELPSALVKAAVSNASRPMAFSSYNRRKIVDITCALLHKKYMDKGRKERVAMSLDRKNQDRDYLYGRLLAVAHKLEYDTFSEEERGKRDTNAVRFTSMFVRNPTKIWQEIDRRLSPYRKKLNNGIQTMYQKEFQEIYDLFIPKEYSNKAKLGEQYLLGYNCELSALWAKSKELGGKENE